MDWLRATVGAGDESAVTTTNRPRAALGAEVSFL
jgi:hypothetical protein